MSDEMDRASDELADARLEFAIAEANLAAARADLTRAERKFHKIWGTALANPAKVVARLPQGSAGS